MKVFLIQNNFCAWQAPQEETLETIQDKHPGLVFVEAPDHVFEGWGYINQQFIKPTAPAGWLYDDQTGALYPENYQETLLSERYEALCNQKIRERYTNNDENQILREYLANPTDETKKQAFDEYNQYIEDCLAAARKEVYGDAE